MPRPCTICAHAHSAAIEAALQDADSYRDIATRYDVSKSALARHWQAHMPAEPRPSAVPVAPNAVPLARPPVPREAIEDLRRQAASLWLQVAHFPRDRHWREYPADQLVIQTARVLATLVGTLWPEGQ
jgi:transposase-like protein